MPLCVDRSRTCLIIAARYLPSGLSATPSIWIDTILSAGSGVFSVMTRLRPVATSRTRTVAPEATAACAAILSIAIARPVPVLRRFRGVVSPARKTRSSPSAVRMAKCQHIQAQRGGLGRMAVVMAPDVPREQRQT